MEKPEVISQKVNQILGEIGALKIRKDNSSGVPERATYFQCEIHRKFAIIDCIKSSADLQLGKTAKSSLAKTWNLVARARKDAKASKDDLAKMLIPSGGGWMEAEEEMEVELEAFPFMDLPEYVVREEVLRNLTCPQDKLNIVEVIPSALQLMKWDMTTVRFESALTILIQQRSDLMDWTDLYNLGRVTPYLQELIRKDYEEKIVVEDEERLSTSSSLDEILELVSAGVDDPQWTRLSVFPHLISLSVGYGDKVEQEREAMISLRQVGSRILDISLDVLVEDTLLETMEKLAEILTLLPQLSILQLYVEDLTDDEWEWKDVENVILPDLPSLKLMSLDGNPGPQFQLLKKALLEKYGGRLQQLHLCEVPIFERLAKDSVWDDNQKVQCPHLSNIALEFRPRGNLQACLVHLNLFTDSPLKIISLYAADKNVGNRLPGLLTFLGNQFGNTLEQLSIRCNPLLDAERDLDRRVLEPYAAPTPTWILDLKFPKLKHLTLDNFPNPNGWAFLLQMPALKKLKWCHVQKPNDNYFKNEEVLFLSFYTSKMTKSNIWKLLPRLTRYTTWFMTKNSGVFFDDYDRWDTLSRSACVRKQQKKKRSSS